MDILDKLKIILEDPMWADHSEISKKTLGLAINEIESLRKQQTASVPEALSAFIAERVQNSGLVRRAYNEAPTTELQVALGAELQWWLRLPDLLAAAPSPTGLDNPEAPKQKGKHTFVIPDANMTKIRYIFVDGEMVYDGSEPEQ